MKTEIYPPANEYSTQWVIVMTFADQESLDHWLESPERDEAVARIPEEIRYSVEKMPSGFGAWFAGLTRDGMRLKICRDGRWRRLLPSPCTPAVMLQSMFVSPWLNGILGLSFAMLVLNAVVVSILQWALVPPLMSVLRRWLLTPFRKAPLFNLGTALGMAAILICLAALFRLFAG
ncbi:MAG: hypothetical protein DWQ37_00280 [Planctomycetota bacterium]|nr:MAG: hypothetical protein DWQ37_00280 [Planctomycetota bacterium]